MNEKYVTLSNVEKFRGVNTTGLICIKNHSCNSQFVMSSDQSILPFFVMFSCTTFSINNLLIYGKVSVADVMNMELEYRTLLYNFSFTPKLCDYLSF